MPNKNYIRGRAFEYEAMKMLEAQGYTVFRTAGSHGQYDIIAFEEDTIRLIQCKTKLIKSGTKFSGTVSKTPETPKFKSNYPVIAERWTKFIRKGKCSK